MSQSVLNAIGTAGSQRNRRAVAGWLFFVCFLIWVMVGIGGYTMESGAGLSIMDWKPVAGTLPPLSQAQWNRLFGLYQQIPQYKILHSGMDLAGFKALFWPEYIHRLWGRLIGLAFFLPLVWFVATGRIEKRLIPWMLLLFVLGGLQGAVGWFMVASGFDPNSTAVQPWRLSLHFCFALFLYVATLWTGLNVRTPAPVPAPGQRRLRGAAMGAAHLLALTLFAGTFVSGTHAIAVYNPVTKAGMGAPPADYFALHPWWANFFENKPAVLFDHQLLAGLTTLAVLFAVVVALRGTAARPVKDMALLAGLLVLLQFALGITALVSGLHDIGIAHQLNSVLLLTALVILLHRLRGARMPAVATTGYARPIGAAR